MSGYNDNFTAIACDESQMKGLLKLMITNMIQGAPNVWKRGMDEETFDFNVDDFDTIDELASKASDMFWKYTMEAFNPNTKSYSTSDESSFVFKKHGDWYLIGFSFCTGLFFIANDLEDYFTRHLPEGSYAISDIHSYNGEDEFYHVLRNYDTEDGMTLCGDNVNDGAFFTWDDEGGIPKSEFKKLYNENYPKKDKADSPLDLTMRYVLDEAKWEYIDNCPWD